MKELEGIFIPMDILKLEELNMEEKVLLSIYWFYTTKANQHKCMISNQELMKIIGCCEKSFKEYKKHLVTLGYIKSNKTINGSVVRYIGIGTEETEESVGVKSTPTNKVKKLDRGKNYPNDRGKNYPNDRVKNTPTVGVKNTPQNNIYNNNLIILNNSDEEQKPAYSDEDKELLDWVNENLNK